MFGKNSLGTESTLHNLGMVYFYTKQYQKSLDYLQRSLMIKTRNLGEGHRDVLNTISSIAGLHSERGEYQLAEKQYRKILKFAVKQLFPWQDETRFRSNLAFLYYKQSKFVEALELARENTKIILRHIDDFNSNRMEFYTHFLFHAHLLPLS